MHGEASHSVGYVSDPRSIFDAFMSGQRSNFREIGTGVDISRQVDGTKRFTDRWSMDEND